MNTDRLAEVGSLIDHANTAYYLEGRPLMEDERRSDAPAVFPSSPRRNCSLF